MPPVVTQGKLGGVIATRPPRSFFEAMDKVGLAHPTSRQEIGERFLDLLVAGMDYDLVGSDVWYDRILRKVPAVATRQEAP
jgi:hypothetical protein